MRGAIAGLAVAVVAATGSSGSVHLSAGAIGAGLIHTCALTTAGGVECWGYNAHNELGNGTIRVRTTPVEVSGLPGAVRTIAIGSRHGCALMRAGSLRCWGYNRYGQLGDGTTVNSAVPVDITGLSGVTALAASFHTCALTTGGTVKCWGSNAFGELGDGTTQDRSRPVEVKGLGGEVTAIAAGDSHTCALMRSGGVECWGDNSAGQLGDGTNDDRWTPVPVTGLRAHVQAIAAGGLQTCALTRRGGVKCWGDNSAGQLGDGTTRDRSKPVDAFGLTAGVTAIAAGLRHTCALTNAGGVKCWGLNDHGQVGTPGYVHSKPTDVAGLGRSVIAIAAGGLHSCALTRSGSVKCWGRNVEGQLGDGTQVNRQRPVGVVGFGPAQASLAVTSRSVHVTPGRLAGIVLRCGPAARCRGVLSLSAVARGSSHTRITLNLGSGPFSISTGKTGRVKVKLPVAGYRLLLRLKRLAARARIDYRQLDGTTTMRTSSVTLIAP